jgi:predicted Zn-dependent protease
MLSCLEKRGVSLRNILGRLIISPTPSLQGVIAKTQGPCELHENLESNPRKVRFCYSIVLAMMLLLTTSTSYAQDIIRDSEIERAIEQVVAPVTRAANLQRLKIHILSSDDVNAFTAGGQEIFINSGLIASFPDPEVLRGVIAHEIGHILGKHVIRQVDNIEKQNKIAGSSLAIGLATLLVNPVLGMGVLMGGQHYTERSILKSSRVHESSADQAGLRLLEKSGNTSSGLLELLKYFNARQNKMDLNPYELTHPLSSERLMAMNDSYQRSKFKHGTTEPTIRYNFLRAAAKLNAFTVNLSSDQANAELIMGHESYKNLAAQELGDIASYAKAIIAFRKSELPKALSYIDQLLLRHPNDPYYHEFKGQALFEFGKKESYASYVRAVELLPNDPLIRTGKAVVELTLFPNNKTHLQQVIKDLQFALNKDKDNIIPYYFLSVAYEKIGNKPRSLLASTIFAAERGELKRAKSMARAIIKDFTPDSPQWHKLNDIILTEE